MRERVADVGLAVLRYGYRGGRTSGGGRPIDRVVVVVAAIRGYVARRRRSGGFRSLFGRHDGRIVGW